MDAEEGEEKKKNRNQNLAGCMVGVSIAGLGIDSVGYRARDPPDIWRDSLQPSN